MPSCISYCEDEETEFLVARGILVHEGGHVVFCPSIKRKIDSLKTEQDKKEWSELFNVFADCNNEWKVSEVWPHLGRPLGEKTEILLKSKEAMKTMDNPFGQVIMRCDPLVNWENVGWKPEFPPDYNPELQKFVEETVKSFEKGGIKDVNGKALMRYTTKVHNEWKKVRDNQKEDTTGLQKLIDSLGDAIDRGDEEEQKRIEKQLEKKQKAKSWFKDKLPDFMVRPASSANDNAGELSEKTTEEAKRYVRQHTEEGDGNPKKMDTWNVDDRKQIDNVVKKKPMRHSHGTTPDLW